MIAVDETTDTMSDSTPHKTKREHDSIVIAQPEQVRAAKESVPPRREHDFPLPEEALAVLRDLRPHLPRQEK